MPDGSTGTSDAPRPGDPRSQGPRPPARFRDGAWVALASALTIVTTIQFVVLVIALVRIDVRLSTAGLVIGFVVTVVWLLTIAWLVLGAWRRSVWGCPFDHVSSAAIARRCPRHATVEFPETGDGG